MFKVGDHVIVNSKDRGIFNQHGEVIEINDKNIEDNNLSACPYKIHILGTTKRIYLNYDNLELTDDPLPLVKTKTRLQEIFESNVFDKMPPLLEVNNMFLRSMPQLVNPVDFLHVDFEVRGTGVDTNEVYFIDDVEN